MMVRLNRDQKQLFCAFDLDELVPDDHPIRQIASVLDLSWVHGTVSPHYSHTDRPSIDPELMLLSHYRTISTSCLCPDYDH